MCPKHVEILLITNKSLFVASSWFLLCLFQLVRLSVLVLIKPVPKCKIVSFQTPCYICGWYLNPGPAGLLLRPVWHTINIPIFTTFTRPQTAPLGCKQSGRTSSCKPSYISIDFQNRRSGLDMAS